MKTQVPIEEATPAQLRAFARTYLQLDGVHDNDSGERLKAKIGAAWTSDFIFVDEEPDIVDSVAQDQVMQTEQVAQIVLNGSGDASLDPMIGITIGYTDMPGGKQPVAPSVNGSPCLVMQRNQRLEVPYRYYEALINAKAGIVEQDKDTKEIIETEVTNFPVTVWKWPTPEEIAAHRARTSAIELG